MKAVHHGPQFDIEATNSEDLEAISRRAADAQSRDASVVRAHNQWVYEGGFTHKSKGSLTGRRQGPARKGLALQGQRALEERDEVFIVFI